MLRETMVENGKLRGIACGDPRVTVYKGVPYAKPPVGELRWRAPQPMDPWEGVRQAETFPPIAWQGRPGVDMKDFYSREIHPCAAEYPMSEDCLYLNIWTPARGTDEKLPVFYYIHGGGFCGGYSYELEFDGERVARNGVIFVTVGYRLGPLGFLAHKDMDEETPGASQGNFGLLDQLAGLEWVKRNIAAFGGDPEKITIGGQSAGGMSVQSLLASPMAQGKFQGAIMMSCGGIAAPGNGIIIDRSLEVAQQEGEQFFAYLGVKTLAEARRLDAQTITATGLGMRPANGQLIMWVPTQDGVFLKETVRDAFIAGRTPDIPCMIGGTWGETRPDPIRRPELGSIERFEAYVRAHYGEKAEAYLAAANVHTDGELAALVEADESFAGGVAARSFAHRQARDGKTTYVYMFDHDVPGDNAGSYHGSDMWFTFNSLNRCWRPFTGKHYDLARQVCAYWTNFVKYGDPNGCDSMGAPLLKWSAYQEEDPFVICFRDEPQPFDREETALMRLEKARCLDEV